jgi:hypothetical protein
MVPEQVNIRGGWLKWKLIGLSASATIALRATGQPREAGSCEGIDTVELLRNRRRSVRCPWDERIDDYVSAISFNQSPPVSSAQCGCR